MPKRKLEVEYINWKIKKLKKKLKKRSRRDASPASSSSRTVSEEDENQDQVGVLLDSPLDTQPEGAELPNIDPVNPQSDTTDDIPQQTLEVDPSMKVDDGDPKAPSSEDLDPEMLEILGTDPSVVVNYGTDIHNELATRLQHIATQGLGRETLKELTERYLIPANSALIGAPILNAEIKAAVTETILKRDKGIEGRQNQLATAISGLARVLSKELEDKNKNKDRLKQLMDVCRILCNIQHAESATRRNFAIFSIKKDLKDHLTDTKIDKYLFGENLAETIRSARAVTKSGTEMKTKTQQKPKTFPQSNNLNWRSPAPARKQQGAQRVREAAPQSAPGPSARYNRNTMQGSSSKPSRHPSKFNRRR
ncbi:hypothetical protein PYW07_007699 [Mythimna separata]|uniref:Uncharacterized protein n=1 Tax=Mythimna separata TaxID=271217 RepID=A0AAD7YRD9_MYTSE|nr:hypothetical protein PYW07_007699 [Mythimna separata]